MYPNTDRYELIERYLQAGLSTDEMKAFEDRLRNERDFAAEFEAHKAAHALIIDQELINLKGEIRDLYAKKPGNNNFRNIAGAVTGLMILTFSILWLYHSGENEDLLSGPAKVPDPEKRIENPLIEATPVPIKDQDGPDPGTSKEENNFPQESHTQSDTVLSTRRKVVISEINSLPADELPTGKPVKINLPVFIEKKQKRDVRVNNLEVEVTASCIHTASGSLFVNLQSLEGGFPPYSVSINSGTSFSESGDFQLLPAGTYRLIFQDSQGTISHTSVVIPEKNCVTDTPAVFNPSNGETWQVPVESNFSGRFRVFDRSGNLRVDRVLNSNYSYLWDGTGKNQVILPMGNYRYIILDASQKMVKKGNVTLIR